MAGLSMSRCGTRWAQSNLLSMQMSFNGIGLQTASTLHAPTTSHCSRAQSSPIHGSQTGTLGRPTRLKFWNFHVVGMSSLLLDGRPLGAVRPAAPGNLLAIWLRARDDAPSPFGLRLLPASSAEDPRLDKVRWAATWTRRELHRLVEANYVLIHYGSEERDGITNSSECLADLGYSCLLEKIKASWSAAGTACLSALLPA